MADTVADFSAEVLFAQRLAANEKRIRDKAIRKLRRWLEVKASTTKGFTEADFLKIWKGLHYCMWMQDKPLIQEELAKNIGNLTHVFKHVEMAFLFVQVFFQTEAREWNGIDRWRLDKFMMLVREMLQQAFMLVCRHGWKHQHIDRWNKILSQCIMAPKVDTIPEGLRMHMADIYLDELEKIGLKELLPKKGNRFLEPFITYLLHSKNVYTIKRVTSRIFETIIKWSKQQNNQKVAEASDTVSDEETDDKMEESEAPKHLQFDLDGLAEHLFDLGKKKNCANRTHIYGLVQRFKNLKEGCLPEDAPIKIRDLTKRDVQVAARKLERMEMDILNEKEKRKKKIKKEIKELKKRENEDLKVSGKKDLKRKQSSECFVEDSDGKPTKRKKRDKKENGAEGCAVNEKSVLDDSDRKSKKRKKRNKKEISAGDVTVNENSSQNMTSSNCNSVNDCEMEPPAETAQTGKSRKKKKSKNNSMEVVNGDPESRNSMNDCEMEPPAETAQTGKRRKKKKSKNSSMEDVNGDPEDRAISNKEQIETLKLSKKKEKVKKKALKQKRASFTDLKDQTGQGEVSPVQKQSPGSKSDSGVSEQPNDAVEIWIPNKKYKGKLKGLFEKQPQQKEIDNGEDGSEVQSTPFASFDSLSKTPPAFVRRAMLKVRTPKSEPRTRIKKIRLSTPLSEKRVIFNMKKNTSLNFVKGSKGSPKTPVNMDKRPTQGILKTPASASPAHTRSRPKASDFF